MKRSKFFGMMASLVAGVVISSSTLAVNGLLPKPASSPQDLALSLSDLPRGTQTLVVTRLTADKTDEFDDATNGLIFRDGTSMVQNYVDGFRADYLVPVAATNAAETATGKAETTSFKAAVPNAYVFELCLSFCGFGFRGSRV